MKVEINKNSMYALTLVGAGLFFRLVWSPVCLILSSGVLAGNTVTMAFYYEQKALKKLLYPEARVKRKRMSSH